MDNEPDVEGDLDADLAAAFDAAQEEGAEQEPEEETPTDEPEEAPEEEDTADDAEEEDHESDEGEEDGSEAPPSAPRSWSATEREFYKSLPLDHQKRLSDIWERREGDLTSQFNAKTTELGEKAKAFETLDAVIAPHRNGQAANYEQEAAAIAELGRINQFAVSDPAGYVQWFMQKMGLSQDQVKSGQSDPQVVMLQQQIRRLEQQISSTEKQTKEQSEQQFQKQVDAFAAAKDDEGNLKNEFFSDVSEDMVRLMQSDASLSLDAAYQKACRLNDDVWQVMQEREADKEKRRKQTEAARAALDAKRKGGNGGVKTKPTSTPMKAKMSEDDRLSQIYDRMNG